MRTGERNLRSVGALLACYAFAGVAWWTTMGCSLQTTSFTVGAVGPGSVTSTCYGEGGGAVACAPEEGSKDLPQFACMVADPVDVAWACTHSPAPCEDPGVSTECSGPGSCLVGLNGPVECTAYFCTPASLTVTVEGSSHVTSNPPGIDCTGSICSASFCDGGDGEETAVVSLTPTPRTGSGEIFVEWDGDPDCLDGNVTMDSARSCTARFRRPEVSVSVTGSGRVVFPPSSQECRAGDPPEQCKRRVAAGTEAILVAEPDPGASFQSWGGDCPGGTSSSALLVDVDKSCTASFSMVAVGSGGSGAVEILSVADDESLGDAPIYADPRLEVSSDLSVVSFNSEATNLLPGAPDASTALSTFVRNRSAGTTRQIRQPVSTYAPGTLSLSMSASGRYVAYWSTDPSVGFLQQVYRQDLSTGLEQRISVYDPATGIGSDPDGGGDLPAISGNGRFVAYYTQIPYQRGGVSVFQTYGVVVHDSCAGAPPTESCTPHATAISYDASGASYELNILGPVGISANGRYVAFGVLDYYSSDSFGIVLHDRDTDEDGVYDEVGDTSMTTVVAVDHLSTVAPGFLDASGRYLAFMSADADLPGNAAAHPTTGRAFLRDTCAGVTSGCTPSYQLLSVQVDGGPVGDTRETILRDMSASGRYVTFATNDPLLFSRDEPVAIPVGGFVVVARDTCIGAPIGCVQENRLLSRRTDTSIYFDYQPHSRVSDDGSLAAMTAPRDALVASPNGSFREIVLGVTGFAQEPGDVPKITARSPSGATARSPDLLLTLRGTGFAPGAVASWNASGRPTIFVSSEQLQITIPATDLALPGVALLRVTNPGGDTSSSVSFTVTN